MLGKNRLKEDGGSGKSCTIQEVSIVLLTAKRLLTTLPAKDSPGVL